MVFSCLVLLMCLFAFPFPRVVSKSTIRNSETNSYKGALLNEVQLITFSRNLRLNELLEFRPCDIILIGSNYRDVLVEPSTLKFYVGGSFGLNFIDGSRSNWETIKRSFVILLKNWMLIFILYMTTWKSTSV